MSSLRKDLTWIIVFAACSFIAGIVLSQNIFQAFTPRSVVFKNPVMIFLQAATAFILFSCFIILSCYNYLLYCSKRDKIVPFKGFYWMYSMRSASVAIVFLLQFISIFVAYYWIDTIAKIIASLFSLSLVIMQAVYFKQMRDMKSPAEYSQLLDELVKVSKELEELKEALNGE